ncbi:MAG: hypothetical protein F4Z08_02490 [Chloroflexi bacterium]|nr:hypothetical protein [Chloroflexota bacterium]
MNDTSDTIVSDLREKLRPFLVRNPEADIESRGERTAIVGPWGEDALELTVNGDDDELLNALNSVRMPPRFTALWHVETNELEVIYTALPLGDEDLVERVFEFRFRGSSYSCSFGGSSDYLRKIAHASRPVGQSLTGHRNLQSIYLYEHSLETHPDSAIAKEGGPISFWVRGIEEYDDAELVDLARNLNFHMRYFDRETPRIVIHEEPSRPHSPEPVERYPSGEFPQIISATDIDQHLLSLWESASSGDTFLRFIHYYQILEYAAFYYIRDDVMQTIQRVLVAPDTPSRPQAAARQILEAMVAERTQDEAKIREVIARFVDPKELWRELDASREAFANEVTLDGGFVLPAVLGSPSDPEHFENTWQQSFPQALQRIRNGLVHARESRQSTMIAPTRGNHDRLFPWLGPLSFTAACVILYSNL